MIIHLGEDKTSEISKHTRTTHPHKVPHGHTHTHTHTHTHKGLVICLCNPEIQDGGAERLTTSLHKYTDDHHVSSSYHHQIHYIPAILELLLLIHLASSESFLTFMYVDPGMTT